MRRLYYDTVNKGPAALRCACEVLGPERIMLGTDFPYVKSRAEFRDCVTYVERSNLPGEAVSAILDHNAQALLGLPEP